MAARALKIRPFRETAASAAVALWRDCGLIRPWNDPYKDIERKSHCQPELFLVGNLPADSQGADVLVATAMAGYDGHRGSVYYLAVAPGHQQMSLGRALMEEVEQRLLALGCPKVNVLVRTSNASVLSFYDKLGYVQDDAFSLGKRLIPDI